MCLHKYVLSGMNELHTILCVDWLKNVNCAILRKKTLDYRDIPSLLRHYFHFVAILLLFVVTKIGLAF